MAPTNFDYLPLSTSNDGAPPKHSGSGAGRLQEMFINHRPWSWIALAMAAVNMLLVILFCVHRPGELSALDDYQLLNSLPVVAPLEATSRDERAVVTTLYSDTYAHGVATLGHSLQASNTSARLILLYLPTHVSPRALCMARAAGWTPHAVERIPPPHGGRGVGAHFGDQYTKLGVWALDALGVRSAVYLDGDTLVRGPLDALFDLPFQLGAVPDVFADARGFAVSFNAGVLALRPASATLADMRAKLLTARFPPHNAEQAFLNLYFGAHAVRLPYAYNANVAIKRRSPELWAELAREARVVHYTLAKPFPAYDGPLLSDFELWESFGRIKEEKPFFAPELEWWGAAWKDMREVHKEEWETCQLDDDRPAGQS